MSSKARGGRSTSPSRIPVSTRPRSPGRYPPSSGGSSKTPEASAVETKKKKGGSEGINDDDVDLEIIAVTRRTVKAPAVIMPKSKEHPALNRLRGASPFTDSDESGSPSPPKTVKKAPTVRSAATNIIKQVQMQKQAEKMKAAGTTKKWGGGRSQQHQKESWVARNFPGSLDELFVNSTKSKEVMNWMRGALGLNENKDGNNKSSIALFTGPCGCGKTATLSLIAKELDCDVKEWINPMSLTDFNANRMTKWEAGDEVQGQSQHDIFTTFLFKASTYNTLPFKGRHQYKHKLVLVEDFPNLFYRDHPSFHNLLRHYMEEGLCPLVFVIPDNSSSDASTFRLFPKNLILELGIVTISFNPVAATYMTKFLQSVCSKEGVDLDENLMESVILGSGGDIRCAINTLQFKLMKEDFGASGSSNKSIFKVPSRRAKGTGPKGKGKKKGEPNAVQKDECLILFRALGKVLHSKRDRTVVVDNEMQVPLSARKYIRCNPLEDDVEEFVKRIEGSADTFLSFLQQNYVSYFGDMDDIVSGASYLADSDYILASWPFDDSGLRSFKEKEVKEEVTLLVASRGLMYSNLHPPPKQFRPFKRPMFGDVRTKLEKSSETLHNLVFDDKPILQSFCMESIPYYAKLLRKHPRHWTGDQKNFITDIGTFKKRYPNRHRNDSNLTERDVAIDEEDDQLPEDTEEPGTAKGPMKYKVESKTVSVKTCVEDDELPEEFLIEQYDSDS